MSPYEELYDQKCRVPIYWHKAREQRYLGPELLDQALKEIKMIKDRLRISLECQMKYANKQ